MISKLHEDIKKKIEILVFEGTMDTWKEDLDKTVDEIIDLLKKELI